MAQPDHTPPGQAQRIDVHVHHDETSGIPEKLDTIIVSLGEISSQLTARNDQGEELMADLAALQASVDAQSSVVDGAVALIQGLSQALKDAVAANDPAAIQAVIDELDANTSELATAVDNVPHPEAQA